MRISDWSSDVCSSDLQIRAMLADDLWLANARAANAGAAALALACGDRLLHPVEANELFVRLAAEEAARLRGAGFDFYDWGDRKGVGSGKSVSVRVGLGGRRHRKKKNRPRKAKT